MGWSNLSSSLRGAIVGGVIGILFTSILWVSFAGRISNLPIFLVVMLTFFSIGAIVGWIAGSKIQGKIAKHIFGIPFWIALIGTFLLIGWLFLQF